MVGIFYLQSAYSLLNSMMLVEDIFKHAKTSQYDFVAIADDENLHGMYQIMSHAKTYQIPYIIGMKVGIALNDYQIDLLIYAQNDSQLIHLMRLSTYLQTQTDRNYQQLKPYLSKLLVIVLKQPFIDQALLRQFKTDFKFMYMALEPNKDNNTWIEWAQDLKISLLPTKKTNYFDDEDRFSYHVLRQIQDRSYDTSDEDLSFLTKDKLIEGLKDYPDVFKNTAKIINQTSYKIYEKKVHLPRFPLEKNTTSKDYLEALAVLGLKKRIKQNRIKDKEVYQKRLIHELKIIHDMGYDDYFLIVYDIVRYAKTHDILVGPGRGSAAGSLVAYCLGIVEVDPILYDLLFERFLNPERYSMPDIDMDFPDDKRDEVIAYVQQKYGIKHVISITTFGSFAQRSSLRDIARIMKIDQSRTNAIVKRVMEDRVDQNDLEAVKMIEAAKRIEGLPRHTGTHAAGIILSDQDLIEMVPLQKGPHGLYQSQFEASDLEKIGFLKIDFLGIRNLTVVHQVLNLTKEKFKLSDIPLDDKKTFDLLSQARTTGIFQLESHGIRSVLKKMKPKTFEDLVALLALYRPGPLQFIDEFIERMHGKTYEKLDPSVDDILSPTYGIILYQEQIMKIAQSYAGYTLSEADLLRRGISKKDKEILSKEQKQFEKRSLQQKRDPELTKRIYAYILRFADYGFNRSHSVAYALLSYHMAYLKTHYFKTFMSVLASSVISNDQLLRSYLEELKASDVSLLKPSIQHSTHRFIVQDKGVVLPLLMIKGIGIQTVDKIIDERKTAPFKDYLDFKIRMKGAVNEKNLEALIHSGALDVFGQTHQTLVENKDLDATGFEQFIPDFKQKVYQEYTEEQLASYEKDVYGFNLFYQPGKKILKLNEEYNLQSIDQQKDKMNLNFIGKIQHIKVIQTKKQEAMAFMTLTDGKTNLEVAVFPKTYQAYQPWQTDETYYQFYVKQDNQRYHLTNIKKV